MSLTFNIKATSGAIKQDSVIKCNDKYYGNHGNPTHWHIVTKKDGKWVSISSEVEVPACYIEPVNEQELVTFSKCVDGDTAKFIINNEEKIVRFLAIDTPESVHPDKEEEPFAKEASEYTCNVLKNAKEIYLEYDGNSDKEDKYGRVLAFVYVDGSLLEKKLIENGLAKVAYIYGDYAHVDELKNSEQEAQNKKIGIWSEVDFKSEGDVQEDSTIQDDEENDIQKLIIKIIDLMYELLKKIIDLLRK
jgi:micrococcal nuclease